MERINFIILAPNKTPVLISLELIFQYTDIQNFAINFNQKPLH